MISVNYFFAHRLVPRYVRENEEILLEKFHLNQEDGNAFLNYMNSLWQEVYEGIGENEEKLREPHFEISTEVLNRKNSLLTVKMPEPKGMPEAKYIAFLFSLDKPRIRYFTYEIASSEITKDTFFVCEWSKKGDHLNYGNFQKSELKSFTHAVKNIVRHNLPFKSAYMRN